MLIKDVCKLCHVTKKALVYYEDKGLISPLIMENGYRDYSQKISRSLKKFVF
ncbi:MAG: MerR family transcriptional regulator [Coprobacillus cateniformis]